MSQGTTTIEPTPGLARRSFTDLLLVVAVYAVALAGAVATGKWAHELHPLLIILLADVVGTVIVFGFSTVTRNASMYDPYWSVAPPAIVVYLLSLSALADDRPLRQFLVAGLVFLWGARLTYNWWSQWNGRTHEDWRYVDLRSKTGRAYWLVNLAGIHLMPTLMVFGGCLALWPALASGRAPLGWLDAVAFVLTATAIALEATADRQLRDFRASRPPRDAILDHGVWSLSRHPNYLGEVAFWWGIALFGLAAAPEAIWILAGPVAITALFWFISIPLIERRMLARRPHYARRMETVPRLFPWRAATRSRSSAVSRDP